MTNFETNDKIEIIRDFVPMPQPQFNNNEHAIRYIIWNLYNRVCEALESFLVLLDNQRYYDAFIIAGHALETCSVLSYIKDNDAEAVQLEKYNRYIAGSAVGRLIAILEMGSNLEQDSTWNAYVAVLKIFYPVGASIIKVTNDVEEKHKEVGEKIKFRIGANAEKIKLLRDSYKIPRITGYIAAFSKNMDNIDDGEFFRYYTKYCNYKHSNMLAPGALAGDIDAEEIDYFLDLVLGIILYLKKFKFTQWAVKLPSFYK
ncbi:DUF5677 domain-containing protein [Endomicrobium proavitum]|uniref:Uncharacterized protein n=1 Tax=Endomicrobium proavitum TaxID=1408281 RepID=A0A0G3WHL7_9BACT|nr:DUF5677 domain-containing protein [Endomicrobium proavitum]AKL98136.1 hypothetical protein Epro_0757 [Endomicrobium proavitum]